MRELVALTMPGGDTFVETMTRVWDDGDAILPVDPRLPVRAVERLFATLAPAAVIDETGERSNLAEGHPVESGDALVIATSGSTGDAKGVIHTHDSIAASARATSARLGVEPASDRWLSCLPLSHVAGLSVVLRALHLEVPFEVLPTFDSERVTAAAQERGATLTTLVPTALSRIDPAIFRRIVVGGAAPPKELPANCVVSYGMTETGSAIAYDGMALDGAELKVVDGEIHVRGPMLFRAYRGGEHLIQGLDPKDADGWFATNDSGAIGGDLRLQVHGRRGELIITGGENVWPNAVERAIETHPDVAEVAVIGRQDAEWGQIVVAIVVPATDSTQPSLDALRGWVRQELPSYAAPRAFELVAELPRTPLGKLDRLALRALDQDMPR